MTLTAFQLRIFLPLLLILCNPSSGIAASVLRGVDFEVKNAYIRHITYLSSYEINSEFDAIGCQISTEKVSCDTQNRLAEVTGISISTDASGVQSVSATQAPAITTQYGPRPDSEFTTGVLFIKTKNSNSTASVSQDTVAYFHHDHLQTPMQATDKAGNIVWAAKYDAFGKASIITPAAAASIPTIESNLRLPGQYEDQETGLHYNYRRYYDTQTGRYITQDPIGLSGGLNQYIYAGAYPTGLIDPNGLWAVAFGFNLGPGFQVTFGRDSASDRGFMDFKLGWGLGATAKYDPLGGLPNSSATECGRGGVDIRTFLEVLKLQAGPVDAKLIDVKAGYTLNATNHGYLQGQANRYYIRPKPKAQFQGKTVGIEAKIGSVGVGFSIFSGADSCKCQN